VFPIAAWRLLFPAPARLYYIRPVYSPAVSFPEHFRSCPAPVPPSILQPRYCCPALVMYGPSLPGPCFVRLVSDLVLSGLCVVRPLTGSSQTIVLSGLCMLVSGLVYCPPRYWQLSCGSHILFGSSPALVLSGPSHVRPLICPAPVRPLACPALVLSGSSPALLSSNILSHPLILRSVCCEALVFSDPWLALALSDPFLDRPLVQLVSCPAHLLSGSSSARVLSEYRLAPVRAFYGYCFVRPLSCPVFDPAHVWPCLVRPLSCPCLLRCLSGLVLLGPCLVRALSGPCLVRPLSCLALAQSLH
jgi:hypothetical protein